LYFFLAINHGKTIILKHKTNSSAVAKILYWKIYTFDKIMTKMKTNNIKSEIVSPAGNPEKLRFAVKYGADTVYFGGDEFNLRIQSGNFNHEEIKSSLQFCNENNVKSVFLLNSFLHEADIRTAEKYISSISDYKFDGIMVADPAMMLLLKDAGIDADFHLSTQMNTLNHVSIRFWNDAGFKRIVLGREVSLDEIRLIRENTDAEIEVFAHGALCVAYSGRCLLSRYMSGRDANQGDCSQPCRWKYSLIEEKRPGNYLDIIEHAKGTEILSSKDLRLIERLDEYVDAGVNAFKIEGRMKSLYHAANTTRIYKHAVSVAGTEDFKKFMPFWLNELDLINHRPYTADLFNEFENLGFSEIPYIKKAMFLGYKTSAQCRNDENEAFVKAYNPIYEDEEIEGIFPINDIIKDSRFRVKAIYDPEGNKVGMARPNTECLFIFDKQVDDDAIFRRRLA